MPEEPQTELLDELSLRARELGLASTSADAEGQEEEPPGSDLEKRMRELKMDPTLERAAASARIEESAAVVLDRNELRRRYYEEFFKARVLRGVVPEKPTPTKSPRSADLLSASGFASALVATGGAQAAASAPLQGSPWPGDRERPALWVASAEVRHGRAATVGLLFYLTAASHRVAGDWGAFAQSILVDWQHPPPQQPPLPWSSEVWTALPPGTEWLFAGIAAVAVTRELLDVKSVAGGGSGRPAEVKKREVPPARAAPLASLVEAATAACEPTETALSPQMARLEVSEVLHGRAAMLLASPLLFQYVALLLAQLH